MVNYQYYEKIHVQRNAVWVITDIKKHTHPKKWCVGNSRPTERYMPNHILCVNRIKMAGDTYLIKSTVWIIIDVTTNTHVRDILSE